MCWLLVFYRFARCSNFQKTRSVEETENTRSAYYKGDIRLPLALEESRGVLASSSDFSNCSPYFVSMASSLLIYNASKNQLKLLGTKEDLLDLLLPELGIDSNDFQVKDNGTCLVLKVGLITCNFYTKAKTLQIQGKENAEKLKLNFIELAKERLPEKLFDEVLWPESEKQSGEEVIELDSAAAKDPNRCCNNCSDTLEMFLLLRKDISDLKEQIFDFISKESCIDADVCSHPDADINDELRHQQELNGKLSNNLRLQREEK